MAGVPKASPDNWAQVAARQAMTTEHTTATFGSSAASGTEKWWKNCGK